MQVTVKYHGDARFIELLEKLGIQKPFFEIKAVLTRASCGKNAPLLSLLLEELLGADQDRLLAQPDQYELLREQILGLWHEVASPSHRVHFFQFPQSTEKTDLIQRIKVRLKEVQILMPIFSEFFQDPPERVKQVDEIKSGVIGSLEKMKQILDALLHEESHEALSTFEKDLDHIDTALESRFNQLRHLLSDRYNRPQPIFIGPPGEA